MKSLNLKKRRGLIVFIAVGLFCGPGFTRDYNRNGDAQISSTNLEAQNVLRMKGYAVNVDGILDQATVNAIKDFQQRNALIQTGTLDALTLSTLGMENFTNDFRSPASVEEGQDQEDTLIYDTMDIEDDEPYWEENYRGMDPVQRRQRVE